MAGSRSKDAKKNASAKVLRPPALRVFRNDGACSAESVTGFLLITTLQFADYPLRLFTDATSVMIRFTKNYQKLTKLKEQLPRKIPHDRLHLGAVYVTS